MNLLCKSFAVAALAALAAMPRSAMASSATASTGAPLSADYDGGTRLDLSGTWDFQLDAKGVGEEARWFTGNAAEGWSKLRVPGSFNDLPPAEAASPEQQKAARFYQGAAWYRTRFVTPSAKPGTECFLHLSGTVLRHTVWLNGQRVGQGNLPYLDAAYDVTALLAPGGTNSLVIEVNNSIEKRAIPDQYWHGWWDEGGLIRPVYLELRPSIHGQSYVSTAMLPGGGWNLAIDTRLERPAPNSSAASFVSYSLLDAGGKTLWKSSPQPISNDRKSEVAIPAAKPWSPDHPTLYTLRTSITSAGQAGDVTSVRVGFRQIAVRGTQILLNGEPFVARGLSRHQFLEGAGMSLSVAQDRRDLQSIKALGANFVRLAHYSQSQDVYDACDELGLLVWTEIPAWQTARQTLADPAVWRDSAQPQLQQMVLQHRNHPSVVVWSVANEIPSDTPEGAAYVAKAVAYVKTLDDTRLVTFASDRREKDLAFSSVDVISINEYFGWYYGASHDVGPMLDELHARFPHQPILVTEFGDEGIAGWKKDPTATGSRDYSYDGQVKFLLDHLQQIFAPQRRSFMAGGLIWLYNDFPDPHQVGKDRPLGGEFVNTKGLVTVTRQPKPAYTAVQAFFEHQKAVETTPQ